MSLGEGLVRNNMTGVKHAYWKSDTETLKPIPFATVSEPAKRQSERRDPHMVRIDKNLRPALP